MGDKEPRRRKKQRKDSQKKDDVRSEDQFFSTIKSESRDSDQEVEEDTNSHGHHHDEPSSIAKILFVILFSGLVVFISFIFISLHGADRGPVDIFDASHGDHHAEELHGEHLEGTKQEDHDHGHDHHEENEVKLEDFIPGLSSIFSFNNEDIESQDIPPEDDDKDDSTDEDAQSYSIAPEIDQGVLEEYVEDTSTDSIEEPLASEMYPETTMSSSIFEAETSYYSHDYSESEDVTPSTPPEEFESTLDPFTYEEPDDMPVTVDSGIDDDDDDEPDSFSIYERADITNDDDYRIRDQLDELDDLVRKDLNRDKDKNVDDDNGEDDDDDDEDDEDEGVEEEFDFWQF